MKFTLKRIDGKQNSDMIQMVEPTGVIAAIMHVDTFWGGTGNRGDIHLRLSAGEEVAVEVIARDD